MTRSESISALTAALHMAQSEIGAVPFNSTNKFLGNKFADLGAVIEHTRPVLHKHGLAISQFPVSTTGPDGTAIGVTSILMHKSGEFISETITLPLADEKGKSQAQLAGSNITYLRRYAWSAIIGLYADEDTDGNEDDRPKQATNKTTTQCAECNAPAGKPHVKGCKNS